VLKQQITLGLANELRCVARQFAVGNAYARNRITGLWNNLTGFRRDRFGLTVWRQERPGNHEHKGGTSGSEDSTNLHDLSPF
jgi:hypothetical protein